MRESSQQARFELPADHFKIFYRRHFQGALVRSGAGVTMWIFSLFSYLSNETKINNFTGVSLSVLYLISINPPTLLLLKRLRDKRSFRYASFAINILEIFGYTAIIYSLGGSRPHSLPLSMPHSLCMWASWGRETIPSSLPVSVQ